MPPRPSVDFLIVVALPPEFDALERHFGPLSKGDREHFATVRRTSGGNVRVAIVDFRDMGPVPALQQTEAALHRVRAPNVLLVGIAGGFPERGGPRAGDLMVP